jgi:hypothetical protein
MATKSELVRRQLQREARPARPKKKRGPKRNAPIDTSRPGVSATDRSAGNGHTGSRNVSRRAGAKGGARLEDSATGKPSRKSSRKSAGRVKTASNLERRAIRRASSPQFKAAKAKARSR